MPGVPRRIARLGLLALLAGCFPGESDPYDTVVPSSVPRRGPVPDDLAPVSAAVEISVKAKSSVGVGDDLGLEIWARNRSGAPVSLVRPVYGSWRHARQPDYRLEWTDAQGARVPDPLGFGDRAGCGVLDPIKGEDRLQVAPARVAVLYRSSMGHGQHEVLGSARPGRYTLRVRYLGENIPGATSLHLLSDAVEVEIRDGDAAAWACRAEQLRREGSHSYANVTPARLFPADDGGWWLIFDRYIHVVRQGEMDPRGELRLRKLGPDLAPIGDSVVLLDSPVEVGYVSATPVPDGVVAVFTPGAVGGRSIQTVHVSLGPGGITAATPSVIQSPPGNPYITSVARSGDRLAVLHDGPGRAQAPLMLTMLDLRGAKVGRPTKVAPMSTEFRVDAASEGVVATWLQRAAVDGGVVQRFDLEGRPVGAPVAFELDPAHGFAGVRHHSAGFDLAFADAGSRGDDPKDMRALYLQRYDLAGQVIEGPRPLSPESRTEAYFGRVAWSGDRSVHAYLDGSTLRLGRSSGLSTTAEERLELEARGDRLTLVWEDTRDDTSPACARLKQCAPEAYAVFVGPDGEAQGSPTRLTHDAIARPLIPLGDDWQQYCP